METTQGNVPLDEIKRLYAEGAEIKAVCPECGSEIVHDLSHHTLYYPEIGKYFRHTLECPECEADGLSVSFEIPVKITSAVVKIEYDPDKIWNYIRYRY